MKRGHKRTHRRQRSIVPAKVHCSNGGDDFTDAPTEEPVLEPKVVVEKIDDVSKPDDQRNYRRFSSRSRKQTDFYCPNLVQEYMRSINNGSSKSPKVVNGLRGYAEDEGVKQIVPPPEKNTSREYTPHVVMLHDQQTLPGEDAPEGVVNESECWSRTSVIKEVLPKVCVCEYGLIKEGLQPILVCSKGVKSLLKKQSLRYYI